MSTFYFWKLTVVLFYIKNNLTLFSFKAATQIKWPKYKQYYRKTNWNIPYLQLCCTCDFWNWVWIDHFTWQ